MKRPQARSISLALAVLAAVLAAGPGLARPARAADDAGMLDKGLEYLCSHQNADGSFGEAMPGMKAGDIGITALVVKSLVESKGNADVETKKAPVVEKAVAYFMAKQRKDGAFADEEMPGLTTYRTGLAVMALVAVDKTKYKDAIAQGVKWLSDAQFQEAGKVSKDSPHYGGWGYDNKGKPDADLSNSQFALLALKAAGVTADDPVMKRALEFLSRCQNDTESNKGVTVDGIKLVPKNDGGFYYGPSRATVKETEEKNADGSISYESYGSMTYAGLVSLCYAGLTKDDPRVKAALGWIKAHYTLDENAGLGVHATDPKGAQRGLYYYYFTFSRALDAMGSDEVETKDGPKKWGRDLLDALKTRQKPDGSWVNEADRWREGSPTLVTAYCVTSIDLARKHAK